MIMTASEILGFLAAALVLITFAMKDMRLLRTTAILSNLAFIIYAWSNGLPRIRDWLQWRASDGGSSNAAGNRSSASGQCAEREG